MATDLQHLVIVFGVVRYRGEGVDRESPQAATPTMSAVSNVSSKVRAIITDALLTAIYGNVDQSNARAARPMMASRRIRWHPGRDAPTRAIRS